MRHNLRNAFRPQCKTALTSMESRLRPASRLVLPSRSSAAPTSIASINRADRALYEAKKKARGGYRVFRPETQIELDRTSHLHMDLNSALARNEFSLEFQPIIQLSKHSIVGVEALIRWHHPERGRVSPAEFIPIAEESGLITELGTWVLRRACEAARQWPEAVKVSVNVSPRQFELDDVRRVVSSVLRDSGLPASRLKLEVTESVLLSQNSPNLHTLQDLRDLNVTLVLDDFGTGYSSLSYLDLFKFDFIKIDKSFVSRIHNPGDRHPVFEAIMGMAKALGLPVTAEGIETATQLEVCPGPRLRFCPRLLFRQAHAATMNCSSSCLVCPLRTCPPLMWFMEWRELHPVFGPGFTRIFGWETFHQRLEEFVDLALDRAQPGLVAGAGGIALGGQPVPLHGKFLDKFPDIVRRHQVLAQRRDHRGFLDANAAGAPCWCTYRGRISKAT